ncbi:hypothetical protein FZI93_31885, partial [Mycobacterium sp. CBMA361]|nr:hypothetical protein [Mycolicibacterium sp. CBMA 361]
MFKIAPLAIAGTAAAAAIALAACSPPSQHDSTMPATSSQMSGHNMPGMSGTSTSGSVAAANFNDADVMF